ncbi:MAG: TIGR01777 family oxidoreductase [Acidimicrobiia bacterium]|nr:TIGR01777 family oxidoreductase [Acidimicrobiia bacterium]
MRVLITGASGLIGTALRQSLEADGASVVALVRRKPASEHERQWDPANGVLDPSDVEGFDAVVHLAGAGIGDKRLTAARKKEIFDSRVDGTSLLADRLAGATNKPRVFVSSSAIGYYGDRAEPVTEQDGPADPPDFLASVCIAWESAADAAVDAGIRTPFIRTGIVLAANGGALQKLLLPFRLGIGGRLGSGKSWWSWISIDDQVRAIRHLIDADVSGPVNLTAPQPATNAEVTKALGKVLRRPTLLPVPRFVLELILGKELAAALLFTSARVLPERLEESGFEFEHRDVESALRGVLAK